MTLAVHGVVCVHRGAAGARGYMHTGSGYTCTRNGAPGVTNEYYLAK